MKKYALAISPPSVPGRAVPDRIVANGSGYIAPIPPPLEPAVPALRARYPNLSDDERVLRFLFPDEQVDAMLAAQPKAHEFSLEHPLVELVREAGRRRLARVHVSQAGMRMDLSARPGTRLVRRARNATVT